MDTEVEKITESFDLIPPEVQEYVYNASFLKDFENICQSLALSASEEKQLRGSLFGYIATNETGEDLLETIKILVKTQEKQDTLISWIKQNVTNKILKLVTNGYINEPEEDITENVSSNTVSAPSPREVLGSIQERLITPTAITPTQREQSITKPNQESEKNIDPYREQIG